MGNFEATNHVFNITDEKSSVFSKFCYWSGPEKFEKVIEAIQLMCYNDSELHVTEVKKMGLTIVTDFSMSDPDTFKNEIIEELKNVKYNDLDYMVYRLELTYDEVLTILDTSYFALKTTSYTLSPGKHKISEPNLMLKSVLPSEVKIKIQLMTLD